jgi:hypothetical protein
MFLVGHSRKKVPLVEFAGSAVVRPVQLAHAFDFFSSSVTRSRSCAKEA